MSTKTLSQLRELILRYNRANGAGSVKIANAMIPEMMDLLLEHIDEATGNKTSEPSNPSDDLAFFQDRLRRCESRYGPGSPECEKARAHLDLFTTTMSTRKAFYVDTGRLSAEAAKEALTEVKEAINLATLTQTDQEAYVEAQFRVQGITNNGARYTGPEERVEYFVSLLKARETAETCVPCTVQEDGTSAIDDLIGRTQIAALVADVQVSADLEASTTKKAPAKKTSAKKPTK